MPLYYYKCKVCGSTDSDIRVIADRNNPTACCECDGVMERAVGLENPNIVRTEDYAKPLHSDSLAINPSQIAEHKKLFPDIEIDSQGRPVFKKYRQHDRYLEACGFDKKEQRIKPKGKRIDELKQPSK